MARIASPTRGAFIREQLSASPHTQQDMANYLDASIGRVHKILQGDDMLVSEGLNVCRFLNLYPEDLLAASPELQTNGIDVVQGLSLASRIMVLPVEARDALITFLDSTWAVASGHKQSEQTPPPLRSTD